MSRLRFALGTLVCVVVPLASRALGGGALAYPMYATTLVYRLEIVAFDASGTARRVSPSDLVPVVSEHAAPFLAGADRLREVPQIEALRAHLGDVGDAACRATSAARVDVILYEGAPRGETMTRRTAHVPCECAE